MNRRWMTSLCLAVTATAACVQATEAPTSTADQANSIYCGQGMPPTPYWDGKVPKATGKQIFLAYRDVAAPQEWVGVLAEPANGKLVWAARVPVGDLGLFIDTMANAGQIDVGRRPIGPIGPIGPGGQDPVAFLLEWARLAIPMQGEIEALAACP